jgi:deoxyribodipyrimidine photo-lyase
MLDSVLVWFRRDLRDNDHAALAQALRRARRVFCAFILDREILDALPSRSDRRVEFIRKSLLELDAALLRRGGALIVRHGWPRTEIPLLADRLRVSAVFANRDYEPQAKRRDQEIEAALQRINIGFELFKDQAIFDGAEVLTQSGRPYSVYTPYKHAWLKRLTEDDLLPHDTKSGELHPTPEASGVPSLADIGFLPAANHGQSDLAGMSGAHQLLAKFEGRIANYNTERDFPALDGTSRLSVHLRFGTISIRRLVTTALRTGPQDTTSGAATWLSELIWREFYFMILDHFPHVVERSFKPEFDAIAWENGERAEELFAAWRDARTGYPLVDAAMRQLNNTGYMHNRLRMIAASFLVKDLGIDWRRGESWFARQLNDFDLSANNGGWQWVASSGCDAQPYFRIFNPVTQSTRFDRDGEFIRRYLPELARIPDRYIHAPWQMDPQAQRACGMVVGRDIQLPIVMHDEARRRTLERYAVVKR